MLDEHFAQVWQGFGNALARHRRRARGLPTYRLIRYADDFVVMVSGGRDHAEALRDETAAVLSPMGLSLSVEKTRVAHIDEGFDFLGFRIQRKKQWGSNRRYVYTYPSKKALASITAKVKTITRQAINIPLSTLLYRVNSALRGWTTYFRHGASKATFGYLDHYTWNRVIKWIRRKYPHANWKEFRRRFCGGGWRPEADGVVLFNPKAVPVTRYRYRGAKIPTPWEEEAVRVVSA